MIHEEIPAALAGERLDRIVALITDASRSDAAALVAAGGVQVGMADAAEEDVDLNVPVADPMVQFSVVYDDEHVIVVDKPAGLVVHPGAGNPSERTNAISSVMGRDTATCALKGEPATT